MLVTIKTACNSALECELTDLYKDAAGLYYKCKLHEKGCGCTILAPRYLYHCTDYNAKDEIINNGLLLSKTRSMYYGEAIYLSLMPQYCFGNTCFRVDVDGLNVVSTVNGWEFICSEDIPSDRIDYFGFEENE